MAYQAKLTSFAVSLLGVILVGMVKSSQCEELVFPWGTAEVSLPCRTGHQFNINNIMYWKKNGESYLSLFRGQVLYFHGASEENESLEREDGSLFIAKVDWNSAGTYTCETQANESISFKESEPILLRVEEAPLMVNGCNASSDTNSSHLTCQKIVANGTVYVNVTFTKLGIRGSVSHKAMNSDVVILWKDTVKTLNSDTSTSYSTSYQLGVSSLTKSVVFRYILVDDKGNNIGDFRMELLVSTKESAKISRMTSGVTAAIAVLVSVIAVGLIVLLLFCLASKRQNMATFLRTRRNKWRQP